MNPEASKYLAAIGRRGGKAGKGSAAKAASAKKANARLLASSPELLTALKYITTLAWWSENDQPSATNMEARLNEILSTARDAIAKSEGK